MIKFKNKTWIGLAIILIALSVSACGPSPEEQASTAAVLTAAAASPTPLPSSTPTPTPTLTPTPVPSDTPKPTLTPTPAPEIIDGPPSSFIPIFIPAYSPEEIWQGFPIHSSAIKGQEYMGGYHYSIYKTVAEIKDFYQLELGKSGWRLTALGESAGGSILVFQNDADQIRITITDFGKEMEIMGVTLPPRAVFIEK